MLVGEEEGDVAMEDKIEVTVHVIGIFCECAPMRLDKIISLFKYTEAVPDDQPQNQT